MFSFQNLLSPEQVTKGDLDKIIELADRFYDASQHGFLKELEGKILGSLFYEPSTRTRLSTETAMLRLGGSVISAIGIENSSLKKGETLFDTGKMVSSFADIIAMRHPDKDSVADLSKGSLVPVINCGDGPGDHPTQALLDVYTMYREFGDLNGLKIAMVGDLKYGRTVHSLLKILRHYQVEIVFIAPTELQMPKTYCDYADKHGLKYSMTDDLKEGIRDCDVIYDTRIQQERFNDLAEYERLKGVYVFTKDLLENHAKESAILMHPLPRIDEITIDCDDWSGARYFEQPKNGVAVRMAIIYGLLNK